jgi:phosphoglycolate phosphatase-like HAD superfamily hydrolase
LKPTLCTDVDSTIWDTGAWVCSAVLEVTGETLDMERITTWTHVLDTFGEKTTSVIFDRVFDPERVRDRQPYPGAPAVLRALQERHGIEIHFVTHNDPENSALSAS